MCFSSLYAQKMKVLVTQSCPTLYDSMDCRQPGSSVHGILQARIWEWVAMSFSRVSSQPRNRSQVPRIAGGFFTSIYCCCCLVAKSCQTLCNPMNCSMPGFSVHGILQPRILSGLTFPSPGDLPNPGIKPMSPALAGRVFTAEPTGKPLVGYFSVIKNEIMPFASSMDGPRDYHIK